MEIKDLLEQNKNTTYRFSDDFTNSVMARISAVTPVVAMWQKRITQIAAACVLILGGFLFTVEGSVTLDAMLGISSYNDVDISATENVYDVWNDIDMN